MVSVKMLKMLLDFLGKDGRIQKNKRQKKKKIVEGWDQLRSRASMTHSPAPTTFCSFMEATSLSRCKLHCGIPVLRSQVNRINKQTVKNKQKQNKKERWSFPD